MRSSSFALAPPSPPHRDIAMDPISISSTLIALLQRTSSLISLCYDYRRGIESSRNEAVAITDVLNSLKAVSEALLRLVETADADGAAQFDTIRLLAKDDGTFEHVLKALGKLSEELELDEDEAEGLKAGNGVEWPLDEDEMKKIVEELQGIIGTMRLALTADKATMTLAIQDDIQDLSRLFQRFSSGMWICFFWGRGLLTERSIDDTRHGLYRWIASCSPHAIHAANREKHIYGTGAWLLESENYKTWLHSPQSFSWLYGLRKSTSAVQLIQTDIM